jgi:hypothetical protein
LMYESRFSRHFYTAEERERMTRHWLSNGRRKSSHPSRSDGSERSSNPAAATHAAADSLVLAPLQAQSHGEGRG